MGNFNFFFKFLIYINLQFDTNVEEFPQSLIYFHAQIYVLLLTKLGCNLDFSQNHIY